MYGLAIPDDYPLGEITLPLTFFYSPADAFTHQEDVDKVLPQLETLAPEDVHVVPEYNHVDFLFGKTAHEKVYEKMIAFFEKHPNT